MVPAGTHPAVVWGVLIGSEIPDIDFVIRYWGGPVTYLKNHRGPTHGLVVLPLHAAVIAFVLRLIWPEAAFGQLFVWTLIGCLSHLVFDFGNDYGTQGLWPFSRRWIALDLIPIVDAWLLGLIGGGWLVHGFWPGHRYAIFTVVWLLVAAYAGLRFCLRKRAVGLVKQQFGTELTFCGDRAPCGKGWPERELTVHPTLFSLNAWRYALQAPGEFLLGMVWLRERRVSEPRRARNEYDAIVKASLKAQVVTAFADWARVPRVQVDRRENLYYVRWSDMRYESDEFSPFVAFAWLDDQLMLVDEGLGRQSPEKVDRDTLRRRLRKEMGRKES